jgi:hypothetical protein
MGLRFLDVELALQWAFCDELPKRDSGGRRHRPPTDYPAASPMFRGAVAERAVVADADGHSRPPGFPAACGETHPDAMIIEAEVAALARFAGSVFGGDPAADPAGLAFGLEGPCGLIAAARSRASAVDLVAAAAEAIASMAGIVACHARAGTRPASTAAQPRPEQQTGPNGKARVLVDELHATIDWAGNDVVEIVAVASPPLRKDVYRAGSYCPLGYRPAFSRVVAERAEYAAWRAGLGILCDALGGRLAGLRVLRPSAPWRPWCWDGGVETAPVLCAPARPVTTREMAAGPRRAMVRRAAMDTAAEADSRV